MMEWKCEYCITAYHGKIYIEMLDFVELADKEGFLKRRRIKVQMIIHGGITL